MPEPNEGWLSMNQLAERYDVHPMTVQRWRSAGTGPPYQRLSPRLIRYRLTDIEEWERQQRRTRVMRIQLVH